MFHAHALTYIFKFTFICCHITHKYVLQVFPFDAVFSHLQLNNCCTLKMLLIKRFCRPTVPMFFGNVSDMVCTRSSIHDKTLLEDFYTKTYTSLSFYLECYKKKCDFHFVWNNIVLESVNTM